MSKVITIKMYKTKLKPVVVYGSETWVMTQMDMKRLGTGERITLRIHGPVVEQGIW
jgi:hypothetical protein